MYVTMVAPVTTEKRGLNHRDIAPARSLVFTSELGNVLHRLPEHFWEHGVLLDFPCVVSEHEAMIVIR